MQSLSPTTKKVLIGLAVLVAVAGLVYLIYTMVAEPSAPTTTQAAMMMAPETTMMMAPESTMMVHEGFDTMPPADHMVTGSDTEGFTGSCGAMPTHVTEGFQVEPSSNTPSQETQQGMMGNNSAGLNQLPSECYPKDVLNSTELLPQDPNSTWAQVVPNGQGALSDQNFITAGFHIGINTVGQTLRNANRQLRSEPPNPMAKVSPWNQTTIEPDINRRPLEIGGDA